MRKVSRVLAASFGLLMLGAVSACEEEGPAEQMGENIDNAVEETGEAAEEAGDRVRDASN